MKLIKRSLLVVPIAALVACVTPKVPNNSDEYRAINSVEIIESGEIDSSTDPYSVQGLNIENDVLEIEVCYGGCADHDWKLVTSKRYKKSLPPQLDVYLIHDQHDDLCKRQNCDTLYFDISELKYPGKPENYSIKLNINKSDKSVNYDY